MTRKEAMVAVVMAAFAIAATRAAVSQPAPGAPFTHEWNGGAAGSAPGQAGPSCA